MMTNWKTKTSAGRLLASLALASAAVGCGDDCPTPGEMDSGVEMDSSVETDSGTDSGTDAGTDAGVANKDIVVVRLTTSGAIDTTYGTNGVAVIDFGSGADTLNGLDIHTDASNVDKVVLFGGRTLSGANDKSTARIIGRVLANGSGLDTSFAGPGSDTSDTKPLPGTHQFNLTGLNDNSKHGHVLPDGTIIAPGYTSQPTHVGMMSTNRIILVRLQANGAPMASFGVNGLVNVNPYDPGVPANEGIGFAEAYSITVRSNGTFVTTGYGLMSAKTLTDPTMPSVSPSIGPAQIMTAFLADGSLDTTFGGGNVENPSGPIAAADATTVVHPNRLLDHDTNATTPPLSLESRGRNIATLPGDAILAVGSSNEYTTGTSSEKDIMLSVLDVDGNPTAIGFTGHENTTDTTGGRRLEVEGGADYSDEACFGVAVAPSGDFAALACYRASSVAGNDTDAVIGIVDIDQAVDPIALERNSLKAFEMSTTENDRFDVVAISSDSTKIYAAGYTFVSGVQQMAVACFQPSDGSVCSGFGTNGFVVIPNGTAVNGIAIDSAGRILVGGTATFLR